MNLISLRTLTVLGGLARTGSRIKSLWMLSHIFTVLSFAIALSSTAICYKYSRNFTECLCPKNKSFNKCCMNYSIESVQSPLPLLSLKRPRSSEPSSSAWTLGQAIRHLDFNAYLFLELCVARQKSLMYHNTLFLKQTCSKIQMVLSIQGI